MSAAQADSDGSSQTQTPQTDEVGDIAQSSKVALDNAGAAAVSAIAVTTSNVFTDEGAKKQEPGVKQSEELLSEPSANNMKVEVKSLEDSVREMLKPMIKDWLNSNMPRILEGAVKEELSSNEDKEV